MIDYINWLTPSYANNELSFNLLQYYNVQIYYALIFL